MSWRPHGHFTVDPTSPRARGVCDRCGAWYQLDQLKWQMQWAGARLQNLRILVCRSCMDKPQEQLRSIILPADPVPVMNPRPEGPTGYENLVADFGAWTGGGASFSVATDVAAPDGSYTAFKLTEDTSTGVHLGEIDITNAGPSVGDVVTCSLFAKTAGRDELNIDVFNNPYTTDVYFALNGGDPYNGSVLNTIKFILGDDPYPYVDGSVFFQNQGIVPTTTEATNVGNGWWWIGYTFIWPEDSVYMNTLLASVFGQTYSYTGDGTSGVYLWKPQLVAGYSNVFPGPSNVETNE